MKWEDFINSTNREIMEYRGLEKTDIECPKCGQVIYKRTDMVLTSYPPKYEYKCLKCGWSDCA